MKLHTYAVAGAKMGMREDFIEQLSPLIMALTLSGVNICTRTGISNSYFISMSHDGIPATFGVFLYDDKTIGIRSTIGSSTTVYGCSNSIRRRIISVEDAVKKVTAEILEYLGK
jgi:hypothetical protein